MEDQSLLRLQNETKSYGLSLFERLVRMEHLLNICGLTLSLNDLQKPVLDSGLKNNLSSLFTSVYLIRPNDEYASIVGSLDTQKLLDIAAHYSPVKQRSQILTGHSGDFVSPLYMLVAIDRKKPLDGFFLPNSTSLCCGGLVR